MTRLHVEPTGPNIRPTEPASSSTTARGGNDLYALFDRHLERAQTLGPVQKLRPKASDDEPARSRQLYGPDKPVDVHREDRRDEIDRHDESTPLADDERQVVTAAESNDNDRHEDLDEPVVEKARHDTEDTDSEDTVAAQVVSDEVVTASQLTASAAHQGEPHGDRSHTTETDESAGNESDGNDALRAKDANGKDPVIIDDAAATTEADTKTAHRGKNADKGQSRPGGTAEQEGHETAQSKLNNQAGTSALETSHRQRDAETSTESAQLPAGDATVQQGNPQQGTSRQDKPRRPNAMSSNHRYGPEPPAVHESPAVDAISPAARSALAVATRAFTQGESGQQSAADSSAQAADEVAAIRGDTASEARSRGIAQDARAELPPQLRAQFGSRGSGEPARDDGLSSAQRARFVQRVDNAFRMASDRGGVIRLRLSPVELGSLRLEIAMRGGVMTAQMEVETSQARSTIIDNLSMLRQRLAEHNIEIERFDVEVRDRGTGETPGQGDRSTAFGDDRQNNNAGGSHTDGDDTVPDSQEPRIARRPGDDSQLNLVI